MTFLQKINNAIKKNNSLVCVGLDSDTSKIPTGLDQFEFNKTIIDATHDLVCAYKPNTAFYEADGTQGIDALKKTIDYIRSTYPGIPIILDAKRADIGNTNEGYCRFAFDYLNADAITLHPYLGREALGPFLNRSDKGAIILCRTSNPGASELQDIDVDGKPLYQHLANKVATEWNANGNCLLVIGATYPEEMANVRQSVGDDILFLVPGIGAQGGNVKATVDAGLNSSGSGIIINSSRGVIFAENPRAEAESLKNEINKYRVS